MGVEQDAKLRDVSMWCVFAATSHFAETRKYNPLPDEIEVSLRSLFDTYVGNKFAPEDQRIPVPSFTTHVAMVDMMLTMLRHAVQTAKQEMRLELKGY